MDMAKTYNPSEFEDRIYKTWEKEGYFTPTIDPNKLPFTIVIPPPNITGQLHMGHALDETLQDTLIRFKRMQGYAALWLPGTDHASIATEVKIVEQMAKEGLTKNDVGREGFLKRAWAWKEQYGGRIVEQLKKLGSSCDWSRLSFTMDEKCSRAVKEVFVNLYNKGLIYQGNRIINWCPHCKTALSDAEVEYEEEDSHLWYINYKVKDSDEFLTVATSRPETMLGDTAVAVNPKDKRYKHLVGKTLILPVLNKEIPVIADDYVELDFGTGAVKITPAHDPNDFEVGVRHNLEVIKVIKDDGTMGDAAGEYEGMPSSEYREVIVNKLKELGALVKIEPLHHNVGHCYRCGTTVESTVSKQWFVKMEPLAKPAVEVVKNKKIKFIPQRFSKIYYNWMENIKDWCISRQLWWGHRIPAYYCDDCGEMTVSKENVTVCPKCGGTHIRQDEDVLDTWFSSALWPFSTLGYPDKTPDLDYFYPTDVLVTGYDIIFFWVARMIFSGLEHMNRIPFKDVLIHGLVRDAQGRKMSKSLGNGIDPLKIIDQYGADTLRFSLINGIAPGSDMRFSDEKLEGSRNFMNKIWNASRFVLMNAEGKEIKNLSDCKLSVADKWIITKLNKAIRDVTVNMERYEMGIALAKLYDFVWNDFCDWYIELTKPVLYGDDETARDDTVSVLVYVLKETLKLLHPFVPFVTQEIYSNIPGVTGDIMVAEFPRYNPKFNYAKAVKDLEPVTSIIKAVRNVKAKLNVAPSKKVELYVKSDVKAAIRKGSVYIQKLAGVSDIIFIEDKTELTCKTVSQVLASCELYIPLGELVDEEAEKARLNKELEKCEDEIKRSEGKLNNKGFIGKAPKALVDGEKEKLEKYLEMREKLKKELAGY
ncbi:MAG TPA: valine--tRNA ligase [Clostridiales bacterium]|nr:valine--tRNA ligase [Clostridiales bacterium]